ncbi:hypothetical protein [Actinomadura miaoliensis]|uniref:FXSXX-COOH protein n=1 Tax=Actinomadura miaoliensis TaxID=430685 RepID=A0ABP7WBD2_9ACTN
MATQVHVADLGGQPDIDYEALGRIGQMPEQEAVRLLDETMTAILFS